MSKTIYAHTNLGATYPGYVNFTREDSGAVTVYVSGDPKVLEDRFYICGFERDKGQPGRCTPGDDRCNNYCNMAPSKGAMQPSPAPCTQVICGETVKLTLAAADFDKLIAELRYTDQAKA
jgi:hypothetical protein